MFRACLGQIRQEEKPTENTALGPRLKAQRRIPTWSLEGMATGLEEDQQSSLAQNLGQGGDLEAWAEAPQQGVPGTSPVGKLGRGCPGMGLHWDHLQGGGVLVSGSLPALRHLWPRPGGFQGPAPHAHLCWAAPPSVPPAASCPRPGLLAPPHAGAAHLRWLGSWAAPPRLHPASQGSGLAMDSEAPPRFGTHPHRLWVQSLASPRTGGGGPA